MAEECVGFGIIGCGVIAPWHSYAITHTGLTKLAAVCDIVPEKAEAAADDAAEKYGIERPRVYAAPEDLLADDAVQAVSICTPSGLHAEIGVAAAQAGKHMLSEKPIDVDLAAIDAMIAATEQAGVKLGCIFQRRTSPLWQGIQRAVSSGALGKMLLGDAYLKYFRSQEYYDSGDWRGTYALDGGGCLMNQGVHCVDLLYWVMGPVAGICGHADHLAGILQGTTGIAKPGVSHRLEFHGETGTIRVDGERIVEWNVPGVEQEEFIPSADESEGSATSDPTAIGMQGHVDQVADLARAIIEDGTPMVPGPEARNAVEIILGVYAASRKAQPVRLPLGV